MPNKTSRADHRGLESDRMERTRDLSVEAVNNPLPCAEMLRIQLRKRQRIAPASNVVFEPRTGHFLEGDTIAIVTADDGGIYRFGAQSIELPGSVRVRYETVSDYHWIAKTEDGIVKADMKREHYGTLILETSDGTSCEMTGLNHAVFPVTSFLRWLLKR